ncbi:MAG: hypothetical protein K0R09_1584 [Clostridiales bacterium]|jgi:uncharacterized protein (TIGR03905 family)|nr:hypothetical protein [Clostridiales bacterium]
MNTYITNGVCSKKITFEVEGNIIKNVAFQSGCNGNLQGIGRLVEGMSVYEVVKKLKGIRCGDKKTSCPDQLAIAIEKAYLK